MIGGKKLYAGEFNNLSQEWQPDGSVIITLSERTKKVKYRMHVKDLYGENEEVLEHEVIPTGPPPWVLDRMKEAKKHGETDSD